jgi:hypothetical protein
MPLGSRTFHLKSKSLIIVFLVLLEAIEVCQFETRDALGLTRLRAMEAAVSCP